MSGGFYKIDPHSGELLCGPNAVMAPAFTLLREERDQHEYPADGWRWFDSEDHARAAYGIPATDAQEQT